ncbi:MAG: hypothetical protein NUV82_00205 [Candidatus Komeilibacteria bacterium]|nr:hypothetical protein [Candidatus Komeilibacteria bacterium]
MDEPILLNKPLGLTSLQALTAWRESHPQWRDVKMTYAGRLDPMAEGALLIIHGEALHRQKDYQRFTKKYEATVLFGVATDSFDVLGKIKHQTTAIVESQRVEQYLDNLPSEITMPLPPFSAYRLRGRPLFHWFLKNQLKEEEWPQRIHKFSDINSIRVETISTAELISEITHRLSTVTAPLRQSEIKEGWRQYFTKSSFSRYTLVSFTVTAGSGSFIRCLANKIGKDLTGAGILLRLRRTAVGPYTID